MLQKSGGPGIPTELGCGQRARLALGLQGPDDVAIWATAPHPVWEGPELCPPPTRPGGTPLTSLFPGPLTRQPARLWAWRAA